MRYEYKMLNTGLELISYNRFKSEAEFIACMKKDHGFKLNSHYVIQGSRK